MGFFKRLFGGGEQATGPSPAPAAGRPAAGPGDVRVQTTDGSGASPIDLTLGIGSFSIGRAASCDIAISAATLSRMHARLHIGADGCSIEDLGSAGGTYVDGTQSHGRQSLKLPCQVRVGGVTLSLSHVGVAPAPQTDPASPAASRIARISSFHASDEQKLAWLEQTFGILAETFKGRALPRNDDVGDVEKWELQVEIHGRPVRLQAGLPFLTPEVNARLSNQRGICVLTRDPEAVPAQAVAGDAWADKVDDDRHFFAPGIFASDPNTTTVFASLDATAQGEIVELMNRHELNAVVILQDVVDLYSAKALSDASNVERAVGERLRMAVQIAEMFEGGASWVGFGAPAGSHSAQQTLGPQSGVIAGPIVDCDFCNTSCYFTPSSMCPNCGAPLHVPR